MFHCLSTLPLPDISKFNTSNVTTMESMFVDHRATYFPNISKWDTSNVTTMREMFYKCVILQSIPYISDWNVSKVTDMSFMFSLNF
jgi:surface protein